jgi:hypothetical protein
VDEFRLGAPQHARTARQVQLLLIGVVVVTCVSLYRYLKKVRWL